MANFEWDSTTKKMKVTVAQQVASAVLTVEMQSPIVSGFNYVSNWDLENTLKSIQTNYNTNYNITVNTSELNDNFITPEYFDSAIVSTLIETTRFDHLVVSEKELLIDFIEIPDSVVSEEYLMTVAFDTKVFNLDLTFDNRTISKGIPILLNQQGYNPINRFNRYKKSILPRKSDHYDLKAETTKLSRAIKEIKSFKTKTVEVNKVEGTQLQLQLNPTVIANGKITTNPQKDIRGQKSLKLPTKNLISGDICYFIGKNDRPILSYILNHKLETADLTFNPTKIIFRKFPNNTSPTNVNGSGIPVIFNLSIPEMEQEWRNV